MKKLSKKTQGVDRRGACATVKAAPGALSRRAFLRNSGLMAGGAALASGMSPVMMKKAEAAVAQPGGKIEQVKTICTHCSVGCGIIAEVQNGVWTGQEPAFDHPFNRGAHCAKGASIRGRRQVEEDFLGAGDRGNRRQDARHSREVRSRFGVLAWFGETQ